MRKGLVKIRMQRPPWIENDPTRQPVNRQALRVIMPASEQFKPLPSDPDLTDRQTVLRYLEERKEFMETISVLKARAALMAEQIGKLKAAVREAKAAGTDKLHVELEDPESTELDGFRKLSISQLENEVAEVQKIREMSIDKPDFSMKMDLVLRRVQDQIRSVIKEKQQ